jgi:hypothetical protein
MATKVYYFSGIGMWFRIAKPDEEYKTYQFQLNLDDDSRKLFKESGLRNKFSDSPFGPYAVVLRRPMEKTFKHKETGEDIIKKFDPPLVVDMDGNQIDPNILGNGSKVVAKMEVYDDGYKKGSKGGRLVAIQVEELVKYERKDYEVANEPTHPF